MKHKLITILITIFILGNPTTANAQLGRINPPPSTNVAIEGLVIAFANLAASLGILAFLVMFIWGCYEWISSAGDKAALDRARARITQGVVGVALLASVWAIFTVVRNFTYTGGSNITNTIPAATP